MTKKEKLATEYLTLRKEFDGDNFKPGLRDNQIWYLVKEFKVYELEDKINAVKNAINEKNLRLKKEAYYITPEGKAYKENLENILNEKNNERLTIHDEFQKWISDEVNKMLPGGWGVNLSIGYNSANVVIGLLNRDSNRNSEFQFGHTFEIYFDGHNFEKRSPRFELNYGTLGCFDLFNDETRPVYLNGLATISNNKEWLQLLMAKFIENVQKVYKILKEENELYVKLNNPKI
ncbi:hypothetical protein IKN40_00945 [bacterium]|nr:hypothetical protein [bacterium]